MPPWVTLFTHDCPPPHSLPDSPAQTSVECWWILRLTEFRSATDGARACTRAGLQCEGDGYSVWEGRGERHTAYGTGVADGGYSTWNCIYQITHVGLGREFQKTFTASWASVHHVNLAVCVGIACIIWWWLHTATILVWHGLAVVLYDGSRF